MRYLARNLLAANPMSQLLSELSISIAGYRMWHHICGSLSNQGSTLLYVDRMMFMLPVSSIFKHGCVGHEYSFAVLLFSGIGDGIIGHSE